MLVNQWYYNLWFIIGLFVIGVFTFSFGFGYLFLLAGFVLLILRLDKKKKSKKNALPSEKPSIESSKTVGLAPPSRSNASVPSVSSKTSIESTTAQPSTTSVITERPKFINRKLRKIDSLCDSYVVIDTETTGLSHLVDEIIEIGCLKILNNELVDRFSTFVKPTKPIPQYITEINHITNDMVKDAPDIKEALTDFHGFVGDLTLVGYKTDFDTNFICSAYCRSFETSHPFVNDYFDVLPLARQLFKGLENYKLTTVAEYLRIPNPESHRAVNDCEVTFQCYEACKSEFSNNCDSLTIIEKQLAKHVLDILKAENLETRYLRFVSGSGYLRVNCYYPVLRFKTTAKKGVYLITDKEFEYCQSVFPDANIAKTSSGESGNTRIFLPINFDYSDLLVFKDLIIEPYRNSLNDIASERSYQSSERFDKKISSYLLDPAYVIPELI